MKFPIFNIDNPETLKGFELDHALARRTSVGDIPTRAARAYGDRRALVDERGELTYRQLETQANRFAHAVVGLGVEAREAIAVLAPNCKEYMVAYFGITKMGAAATLVNMLGGQHHLVYALEQTRPKVAVIHADVLPILKTAADRISFIEHIIVIGADNDALSAGFPTAQLHDFERFIADAASFAPAGVEIEAPLEIAIADRQIAQCLFSSGSTSEPKGIMTSHLTVVISGLSSATMLNIQRRQHQPVTTIALPVFHTAALNMIVIPFLMMGGRVHLLAGFDPEEFGRTVQQSKSTHGLGLPLMLEAIHDYSVNTGDKMPHLQLLGYGMAPVPESLYRALTQRFPHADLIMASGMTEATPGTICQWPGYDPDKRFTWGTVTAHTDAAIFDPATNERLSAGEDGELVLRGPAVMEGYLKPINEVFSGGWLHSGDIGHLDPDNTFVFTDRLKDIVKSGGENVSSVVVEQVVLEHPEVVEAAVVGIPDEDWGERVTAVVVPERNVLEDPTRQAEVRESILQFAREHLNSSHRPREVWFVASLPRTGSGKIQKNRLRDS